MVFKVNGVEGILKWIAATQRSIDEAVKPSPDIDASFPDAPSYYSSPMERPSREKCHACSKLSGSINSLQMEWIAKQLDSETYPLWIYPTLPKWTTRPNVKDYLLKPVQIYHPEHQLGISISVLGSCPFCSRKGTLRFHGWTDPRHVHCLETDAYQVSAR